MILYKILFQEKIDVAYAMYSYKGTFLGNAGAWWWSSNRIVKSEIDALGGNYIVTKSLMAFVKQGYIPKVFLHLIHKTINC